MASTSLAGKRGVRTATTRRQSRQEAEEPESIDIDVVDVHIEDMSQDNPTKNIIIYGPSGGGKTVLALGAPNATVVAAEAGYVSAQRVGHTANLIKAPTWAHVDAAMKLAARTFGPDDWVIYDSITKMQQLNIRWILQKQKQKKASRDLDIPAVQDHQKWQNMFVRYITEIIDAPYNSILVATSMIKEDEDSEDIVLPNLVGKNYTISENVMAEADMVLYYGVSKTASTDEFTVRRALAQPYPPWRAKDRYNCLGKFIDVHEGNYWAMADIIEAIDSGEYRSAFDEAQEEEEEPAPAPRKKRRRLVPA